MKNVAKNNVKALFIEISGVCNAKCPYCVQNRLRKDNHFGEVMSSKLFLQILNHLIEIKAIPKSRIIYLYNWGEPFLNPEINKILEILKEKNLQAGLSSNFIFLPNFDKQLLSVINNITFSLSGFSQKSYGRIHGALLNEVLNNFEKLYEDLRKYSPKTKIKIAWHRYSFNEDEFWKTYRYFNRPGIVVCPVIAYINDNIKFRAFLKNKLPKEDLSKIEQDILVDRIDKGIMYYKRKSQNYHCPQWDYIVISEAGELLLCCGLTRYDYVLGNVLDMTLEEIFNKKLADSYCDECVHSGLAGFVHSPSISFPAGGDIKPKIFYKFRRFISETASLIKKLPGGERVVATIKNHI